MKKFWIFLVLCVIASVFYFGLRAGPDSPNKNTENSAMGHQTKSASVDSFNSVAVERRPSEDEAPKNTNFLMCMCRKILVTTKSSGVHFPDRIGL